MYCATFYGSFFLYRATPCNNGSYDATAGPVFSAKTAAAFAAVAAAASASAAASHNSSTGRAGTSINDVSSSTPQMCKANSTSTPFVAAKAPAAAAAANDKDDEDEDLENFSLSLRGEKRKRHHDRLSAACFVETGNGDSPSCAKSRRLRVSELNVSRYAEEFLELDTANKTRGKYGDVKIVRHRLDGMVYAVKITRNRIQRGGSTNQERAVMNEVFAHAAIVKHKHIVRYYNSWVENGRVYLQTEFCGGGTLADMIKIRKRQGRHFKERELRKLALSMAKALK